MRRRCACSRWSRQIVASTTSHITIFIVLTVVAQSELLQLQTHCARRSNSIKAFDSAGGSIGRRISDFYLLPHRLLELHRAKLSVRACVRLRARVGEVAVLSPRPRGPHIRARSSRRDPPSPAPIQLTRHQQHARNSGVGEGGRGTSPHPIRNKKTKAS